MPPPRVVVALALDEDALAELDMVRVSSDAARRRAAVTERMAIEPRALQVLAAARDVAATVGLTAWTAAADALDAAPMGGFAELVGFVRDEVLAVAWWRAGDVAVARWPTAIDVVADGVGATYAVDTCGSLAAGLGLPWRRWLTGSGRRPAGVDGPAADVLARVAAATPRQLAAVGAALRRQRADGWIWSSAVHDACWAVHLTGRERLAAAAQLHGVRALRAVTPEGRPAPDVVSAVVAAVHAAVVPDVLADEVVTAMSSALDRGLGAEPER